MNGYVWRIIKRSFRRFDEERGFQAAASIAFFAVFSFFPLVLILVVVSSSLFEQLDVQEVILDNIMEIIPVAPQYMIRKNLMQVLAARGTVSALSVVGLLWAASAVFSTMAHSLNTAWPQAPNRNPLKARAFSVLMVVCLVGVVPLFFIGKTMLHMAAAVSTVYGLKTYASTLLQLLPNLILFSTIFVAFVTLYRWVPNTRVRWREALIGAFIAAAAAGLATAGFSWYLRSGLSRYNIVYGSLGILLAYMSWTYLISLIVVYGAHLSAAIAHHARGNLWPPP